MVSSSASGTAIHIPTTSKKCGSVSNAVQIKINVRSAEITADTFPFDKAVNAAEANILKPQNKKLIEKIKKPCLAIWYTGAPFSEKRRTNGEPNSSAMAKTITEVTQIKNKHMRKILFKRL